MNSALTTHVVEQMAGFGPVTLKKMFGATAIYHSGLIFAMVADDVLFFKGDDTSKADFEKEGLAQFTYQSKSGGSTAMSYWRAPAICLDDADEMTAWCRKAYEAAQRSQKPKKKPKAS
jgi:DNA transformation protein and related proteins